MKIPTTVITGFLGAGKTTIIRHLLENVKDCRIALLINEFGDLGIDLEVIKGCDIESCKEDGIIELTNGCICCTVADDFVPAIESLLSNNDAPEHILIETSGLAIPKPLIKAFNWPEIRSRVTVDGVITVVDSPAVSNGQFAHDPDAVQTQREADENLEHESPLDEVFEDQLLSADMIILNKTDLISRAELEKVKAIVERESHPAAKIVPAVKGRVNPLILLGLQANAENDLKDRRSHHDGEEEHDHDDFDSLIVTLNSIQDPEQFISLLRDLTQSHRILRIKGFIDIPDKSMRSVIQAVGPRIETYFDRPWKSDEERHTSLVIIGEAGFDKNAIRNALTAENID